MKKILIILFLFLSVNVFAEHKNSVVVKAGITPYSAVSNKRGSGIYGTTCIYNNQRTNVGTIFYVEYFRNMTSLISVGGGFSQQISRETRKGEV